MILRRKTILIGALTTALLALSAVAVTFIVLEVRDNDPITYVEHDPIVIWGDDDFDAYKFPGKGTENNPYRISEYNITTDSYTGISIWNTKKYFIIENCYINASAIGISIESVDPGSAIVTNNICNSNAKIGILVYDSPQIVLSKNTCRYNGYGLVIDSSSSCLLTENICKNNNVGIIIFYSPLASLVKCESLNNNLGIYVGYSSSSSIDDCKINYNNEGLSIDSSPAFRIEESEISSNTYGLLMIKSRSSIIENNDFNHNYYGIFLHENTLAYFNHNNITYNAYGMFFKTGVDTSTISYNYFERNYIYAINIELSNDNNVIHHNTFVNNSASGMSQAHDDGLNLWYDIYSNSGNFWDDWIGIGSYTIDGFGGNSDLYPLETPPVF